MSDSQRTTRPPTIDPIASARWAAWPHVQSPWLNEEIGRRMEDRLQWIRLQPTSWIDWAPVSGGLNTHAQLRARYPQADCHVVEVSPARQRMARQTLQAPWWKRWLQSRAVTFGASVDAGADMLWANMALHNSDNPQALLQQWHQLLAVDGFLMFSCLGPDTLRELAEVYQAHGWPAPSHAFTDMHDWGDMLVQAGFAEPVMDMERITLTYETPERLLQELRELGRNLHVARFAGLRGRGWQRQWLQAVAEKGERDPGGRLKLTFEVVYGHALKPQARTRMLPESQIGLDDMRQMLADRRPPRL